MLAALQQPAPETFALFDDVMLISEGVVLFHGPRADVLPFFQRLGFACPPRKDPAGFLQEVTSARDQAVRLPAWPWAAGPLLKACACSQYVRQRVAEGLSGEPDGDTRHWHGLVGDSKVQSNVI